MLFVRQAVSIALIATVGAAAIIQQSAQAFTSEWEWKVARIESGPNNQLHPVPSGTYASKADAEAAMRNAYAWMSVVTSEDGIVSRTDSWVEHKYHAPDQQLIVSDWVYHGLDFNQDLFTSEAAAFAQIREHIENQCGPGTFTVTRDWTPTQGGPEWASQWDDKRWDFVPNSPPCTPNPLPGMIRTRNVSCPQHYGYVTNSEPICTADVRGYIARHPMECPGKQPSVQVGNPCNVSNGDKHETVTDYMGPGIRFSRTYHSFSLVADGVLGAGWTHNLAAQLSFSSTGTPTALVRASGYEDALWPASSYYVSSTGSGIKLTNSGSEWIANLADGSKEVYDTSGRLMRLIARGGAITTLDYNDGKLTTVTGPYGHALQLTYDAGRLDQLVGPGSATITYQYTGPNLTSVVAADGTITTYHYESTVHPSHLTGITDESGVRFATFAYDALGRVVSSSHAGGAEAVTLSYTTSNTTVTDALGSTTVYAFKPGNIQSRRVQSITRGSQVESYLNANFGAREVTQITDPRGLITKFTYVPNMSQIQTKVEAFGTPRARTTSYQYASFHGLASRIDEPGRRTEFEYDSHGNVETLTVTDTATSQSRVWAFTYNAFGKVLTINGPRTDVADVTTFTYHTCTTGDECGQLNTVTDAANNVTTYSSYNAHGLPLEITDPNGAEITLTYDARQRLTSRTIEGEMTEFEYWPTGLLKKITQPDGAFISYGYDAAHRLTSVTDTAGNTITHTLNGAGQRLTETVRDAANVLTYQKTRVYNNLGRLIEEEGTDGQLTTFGYDDEGNVTEIEDPVGRITEQTYDELNRLASITDPALELTEFEYDDLDNLLAVIDPRGLETSYVYNAFGERVSQSSPDTGTSSSPRDAAGNLNTTTDARNETGDFTHDALNRVTEIEYGDETVGFGYDAGTNGNGYLTSMTDGSGSTSWSYDAVGRVIERSQTTGSVTLDVGYEYDTNGRLDTLTTPSGQEITYEYDDGRVSGLRVNGSYLLNQVLYQPFGPTEGWTWGNATTTSRTFDTDGQLTSISSAGSSTYTYYADGTIATKSDDFVSSAPASGGTTTYTTSSTSNRLQGMTGLISRSYGYDAAGNATSDGARTFTYNDAGRMKTSTASSLTTTYSYTGLGERVKKTSSAATTLFAYDEAGHLLGEYDASGGLVQETVWFDDIPVAVLKPNGSGISVFYIHTDHLNTPRRITRPSDNEILWRWDSHPFGDTAANQDPDGDTTTFVYNLRFPGQYFDTETGLHYNYFRDYDPVTGRYTQSDPIGLAGGLNTYLYANGNPLRYSDPLGLRALTKTEADFLRSYFGECLDLSGIDLEPTRMSRARQIFRENIRMPAAAFKSGEIDVTNSQYAPIFAHEALHVWQRQNGRPVTLLALPLQIGNSLRIINPYDFDTTISDPSAMLTLFKDANVERQGSIFEAGVRRQMLTTQGRLGADSRYDAVLNHVKACGC